jgi:exosome complex exonuclease DIS3/RRP44
MAASYATVQAVIDDAGRADRLALGLRQLDRLAQRLRERRREAGAFMLNGGDAKVQRAPDNSLELRNDAGLPVNELIEEWMVLANAAVATQIAAAFPQAALLRRHAPPAEESLHWLQLALEERALRLDSNP